MLGVKQMLGAGIILLGVTTGANATVVAYNNVAASGGAATAVGDTTDGYGATGFYESFSTSSTLDISDVLLQLGGGGTDSSSHLIVTLFQDNGSGLPGSVVAQLGDVLDSQVQTQGVYDFQFSTQVLAAGRYWIQVTDPGPASWLAQYDYSGTGVSTEFTYGTDYGGANYANNNGYALQMCVASDSAACEATIQQTFGSNAAPEPASLAILGAAVVGLGIVRRRRKT